MTALTSELPPLQLLIAGEWRAPQARDTFAAINPATEKRIATVACADRNDVDLAVAAAREAFDDGPWSRLSGGDRAAILWRIADLIEADAANLAALETMEIGRPLAEPANVDVPLAVETFRHFAGLADGLRGETVPVPDYDGRRRLTYTVREPVGVVGAITPWNAPTMIAAWKLASALAAGCTVVLKPPVEACLSTLRLVELMQGAGLPAGVVNVLPGRGSVVGSHLVEHPGVDKVSFTGSPEVGRDISLRAAASFKRLTLELGGKSPQIFCADADLDRALPIAAASLFANQGEICAAATRVFVHESRVADVVDGLSELARGIKVGDPLDPETGMGSLINQRQLDSVLGYVEAGESEGAKLVTGGRRVGTVGYFVEPTLFVGDNRMRIAREEIFGPVGTVIPFTDVDDAVRQANDSPYGLTSVVWTENLANAMNAAMDLRAGSVWVNGWGTPDPRVPWGGVRTSGVGRELGLAGLHGNTEEKVVNVII